MLPVNINQCSIVVTGAQLLTKLICTTCKVEVVACSTVIGIRYILAIAGVTQIGFGQTPSVERQPFDFLGVDKTTGKCTGKNSAVIVPHDRQYGLQSPDRQCALGYAHFCSSAQLAPFICWRSVAPDE